MGVVRAEGYSCWLVRVVKDVEVEGVNLVSEKQAPSVLGLAVQPLGTVGVEVAKDEGVVGDGERSEVEWGVGGKTIAGGDVYV